MRCISWVEWTLLLYTSCASSYHFIAQLVQLHTLNHHLTLTSIGDSVLTLDLWWTTLMMFFHFITRKSKDWRFSSQFKERIESNRWYPTVVPFGVSTTTTTTYIQEDDHGTMDKKEESMIWMKPQSLEGMSRVSTIVKMMYKKILFKSQTLQSRKQS